MFVEAQRIVYEKEQNKERKQCRPNKHIRMTLIGSVTYYWRRKMKKTSKKHVDNFDVKTIIYTFARRKEETLFQKKSKMRQQVIVFRKFVNIKERDEFVA